MIERSLATLTKRLLAAGVPEEFTNLALVPKWFEEAERTNINVLAEVETAVARFLDVDITTVMLPHEPLHLPEPFNLWALNKVREAAERAVSAHTATDSDIQLLLGWLAFCENKIQRPEWFAQRYTYRVMWSEELGHFLGLCDELPKLCSQEKDQALALQQIDRLVLSQLNELVRLGKPMPAPKKSKVVPS